MLASPQRYRTSERLGFMFTVAFCQVILDPGPLGRLARCWPPSCGGPGWLVLARPVGAVFICSTMVSNGPFGFWLPLSERGREVLSHRTPTDYGLTGTVGNGVR